MTAPDLKPCPFCGGEARKWQDQSHSAAWFIGCDDGDRDCFGSIHWAETEAEAIAAWNRRATDQATLAALPEVQALIDTAQEPVAWLPTETVKWLLEYDGPACATRTAAWTRPIRIDGGVPVYLAPKKTGGDAQMRAEGRVAGLREAANLYEDGAGPGAGGWDYFGDFRDAIRALADKIEKGKP